MPAQRPGARRLTGKRAVNPIASPQWLLQRCGMGCRGLVPKHSFGWFFVHMRISSRRYCRKPQLLRSDMEGFDDFSCFSELSSPFCLSERFVFLGQLGNGLLKVVKRSNVVQAFHGVSFEALVQRTAVVRYIKPMLRENWYLPAAGIPLVATRA